MKFFDSHAHLDDEKFNEDREELLEQIYREGIEKFVSAGYNTESSKKSVELSKKYNFIYSTCGISPNDIPQTEEELWKMLDEIREIARGNQKVVAIGEIGLDYHWNTENKEWQKKAFMEQIKIANDLQLPIQIHTREAVMDTLEILKKNPVNKKGIFHCCPLNRELVKEGLKLGFYISFAGPITFKNSKNANEMIEMVPKDKMLIETDSPYLSPEPLRGRRNDPRNVKYIAQKIAEVKKISLEEVANVTYQNAEKIFRNIGIKIKITRARICALILTFYFKFLKASILSSVLGCVDQILEVFFLPSLVSFLKGFTTYILAVAEFAVSN